MRRDYPNRHCTVEGQQLLPEPEPEPEPVLKGAGSADSARAPLQRGMRGLLFRRADMGGGQVGAIS